jgi:hypothetical protein
LYSKFRGPLANGKTERRIETMAWTLTFKYPVSGTTPPTAAQAAAVNCITALANALDADTALTITHNLALAAGDPASLFPVVNVQLDSSSAGTIYPIVTLSLSNTNSVLATKGSVLGSNCTLQITISRPHSIVR